MIGTDLIDQPAAGTFWGEPIFGRITSVGVRDGAVQVVSIGLDVPVIGPSGRAYDAVYLTSQGPDWANLKTGAEALAVQSRREYTAYLCMMSDHDCACLALGFDEWARVTHPAVTS